MLAALAVELAGAFVSCSLATGVDVAASTKVAVIETVMPSIEREAVILPSETVPLAEILTGGSGICITIEKAPDS